MMTATHSQVVAMITQQPTQVPGLKYFPDLQPWVSNDQDHPVDVNWWELPRLEVSDCNLAVVQQAVAELGLNLAAALEIGVNRNGERSMSRIIMDQRPPGSFYLGVDIEDKSYLDDETANTWTIQCSSAERERVTDKMRSNGVGVLDLIMIDGWHSVNQCVNDWQFTERLTDHGIVMLHDTNWHPGCIALWDAIDENAWIKQRYCTENDFGIATFKKRR